MLPTFIKFATRNSRRFVEDDVDRVEDETPTKPTISTSNTSIINSPDDNVVVVVGVSSDSSNISPGVVVETKTVITTHTDNESASIVSSISDQDLLTAASTATVTAVPTTPSSLNPSTAASFPVEWWDKKTHYSTYIQDSLRYLKRRDDDVIMLFESPSTSNKESVFYNCQVYKFHDYPPASNPYKTMLGPCRYSMMNGNTYPSYLQDGSPPSGLLEHWEDAIPNFVRPNFVSHLPDESVIYAYLPCESIIHHVNDPNVHYHLAGKDALHLMTKKTTALLHNTHAQNRPCIAKVTHSMASKGIFIIANDDDEHEFESFLQQSGNPNFVVTELVNIERNVACHFFIHPNGHVTWFGSNENYKDPDTGNWSMDSYLIMKDQDILKQLQLPFVYDVVQYCLALGFFGFCGIDVLFDSSGIGYLVDVNPRVTGSCPSLMVAQLFQEQYGYEYGLFRRNGNITFPGSAQELLDQVDEYNRQHENHSKIVLFGFYELNPNQTKLNIGVYGHSLDECRITLNHFAQAEV